MTGSSGPRDPRSVGQYRILRQLGRGGVGRVYLAQSRGGRMVAIKVVDPESAADAAFRSRLAKLVEEMRAVGGLYVAQLVDADVAAAAPWLATEYVPGPALGTAVETRGPLPVGAVRRLGAGLAEGLGAVHGAGLVHQNLKPGNVILAHDGPRLVDFGFPPALESAQRSASSAAAGASGFVAPEQVSGDAITPATDVFCLGCVLVYAATGRGPFGAGPVGEVLYRVVDGEPDLEGVPEEIRDLVADCLTKDPARRPGVGMILQRLSDPDEPNAGWPPAAPSAPAGGHEAPTDATVGETTGPTGPRRPSRRTVLTAGLAGLAAVAAIPVGIELGSSGSSGKSASSGGHGAGPQLSYTPLATLPIANTQADSFLAVSPDGRTLAVTADSEIQLWDLPTRRKTSALAVPGNTLISTLAYSRDGSKLAAGYPAEPQISGADFVADIGSVTVWDTASRNRIATLNTSSDGGAGLDAMDCVAFSPDGRFLAGARYGGSSCVGRVPIWDLATGRPAHDLVVGPGKATQTSAVRCVAYSPDGRTLVAGWGSALHDNPFGGIEFFDAASYRHLGSIPLASTSAFGVLGFAFTPDSKVLIAAYAGVAAYDVASRTRLAVLAPVADSSPDYQSVALSPDGRTVAATWGARSFGGEITLWDLPSRKKIVSLTAGRNGAGSVAFSPDGRTLAAEVDDQRMNPTVELWRMSS